MATTRDTKIEEFRQAERQVLAGHYIKHEDVKAWLLSWGKESELPPRNASAAKITMTKRCAGRIPFVDLYRVRGQRIIIGTIGTPPKQNDHGCRQIQENRSPRAVRQLEVGRVTKPAVCWEIEIGK